ncbi:tetratricopeptide repeat protein [Ekhidna sp.]|uniref:tetratricopeptide repeat protein n=1 Tax=Ekhidna sp. TaxID=2608089 RepID=UPI003BAC540D
MLLSITVLHLMSFFSADLSALDANYWIRQGDRAFNEQNIEESITHYSRAIEDRPASVLGYLKRAKAYRASGQFENYTNDVQKAMRLDPVYTKTYWEKSKNRSVIPK